MDKLGINALQLAAQIVNVGIVFFVLKKFVYKPVLSMLDKRKQTIEEGVELKNKMEKKLSDLTEKEKDLEKKAKIKAAKAADEARKEGEKAAGKIIEEAKAEAKKIVEKSKQNAKSELEREKLELENKIETKAVILANRLLAELLPKETQIKITEAQAKKVSRQL